MSRYRTTRAVGVVGDQAAAGHEDHRAHLPRQLSPGSRNRGAGLKEQQPGHLGRQTCKRRGGHESSVRAGSSPGFNLLGWGLACSYGRLGRIQENRRGREDGSAGRRQRGKGQPPGLSLGISYFGGPLPSMSRSVAVTRSHPAFLSAVAPRDRKWQRLARHLRPPPRSAVAHQGQRGRWSEHGPVHRSRPMHREAGLGRWGFGSGVAGPPSCAHAVH